MLKRVLFSDAGLAVAISSSEEGGFACVSGWVFVAEDFELALVAPVMVMFTLETPCDLELDPAFDEFDPPDFVSVACDPGLELAV